MATKNLVCVPLFVFMFCPLFFQTVQAAGNTDMTEEQMQQLMQAAGKMQECYAKMDQSALQALNAKSEKMQAEVKALCAAGKRDQAQNRAIQHGKEIASSKVMQEMKKCGEMAGEMMNQMPMGPGTGSDFTDMGHVCDSIE